MMLAFLLVLFFFFSSRRRHTRFDCDWSSDVCSSDLGGQVVRILLQHLGEAHHGRPRAPAAAQQVGQRQRRLVERGQRLERALVRRLCVGPCFLVFVEPAQVDRKSTRLNSSHSQISYAVFCLKKKKNYTQT